MTTAKINPPEGCDTPEYKAHVDHLTGRNLPRIIDEPGWYETRRGFRVRVVEISPNGATANCHATAYPPPRKGRTFRRPSFEIYQPNGRYKFLGEHPWDIVKKVTP